VLLGQKLKEKWRPVTIGQLATREVLTQVPEENKTLVTRNMARNI
jgi:hypothetical protein